MNRRTLTIAALIGYSLACGTAIVLGAVSLIRVVPLNVGLPTIGVAFVAGFAVGVGLGLWEPKPIVLPATDLDTAPQAGEQQ